MISRQTINSERHLLHKRCSQHLKQNHGLNMLKKIKPSPVEGKSSYNNASSKKTISKRTSMKGKEGQRLMLSDRDSLGKQGDVLSLGI